MTKPVLFISFRPIERAENIKALYDAYPGDKIHRLASEPSLNPDIRAGKYDIVVTDDIPQVAPPKCIMIWHGIQGGKKICMDQPGHPYYDYSMAKRMTYIISASDESIRLWHSCTQVSPSHILPYGFPRTDQYIGKKKGDGNTGYADKKVYLYVPTFRDRGETPIPFIDWSYLDMILNDDELLIVKAHPWQADTGVNQIKGIINGFRKHIIQVDATEPTTPYLYDADVVITDYSSIMFDAYLLNKPVVLFEKLPGYTETRGMYYKYPNDYCSFYADETQLIPTVRYRYAHPWLTDTEETCRWLTANRCDGHSCERIIDLINQMKGDN